MTCVLSGEPYRGHTYLPASLHLMKASKETRSPSFAQTRQHGSAVFLSRPRDIFALPLTPMRRSQAAERTRREGRHPVDSGGCALPHEILIDIFKLATDYPGRHSHVSAPWTPFEPAYAFRSKDGYVGSLRTKHSLALASSLFRELLTPFLYEHIWIRHGAAALLSILEYSRGPDGLGHGRFVRRVTVSSGGHCTPHEVTIKINTNILTCCPFVEQIIRPQETASGDQLLLDDIDPPYLSRVDWHNTPFDSSFASSPAPRFIFHSRSLRVLVLGADNFPWAEDIEPETVIDLPNLHTLGINSSNSFGAEPRRHILKMPSLQRLIVGRPEAIYNLFSGTLEHISRQIRHLELGADPRFLRHGTLSLFVP